MRSPEDAGNKARPAPETFGEAVRARRAEGLAAAGSKDLSGMAPGGVWLDGVRYESTSDPEYVKALGRLDGASSTIGGAAPTEEAPDA